MLFVYDLEIGGGLCEDRVEAEWLSECLGTAIRVEQWGEQSKAQDLIHIYEEVTTKSTLIGK